MPVSAPRYAILDGEVVRWECAARMSGVKYRVEPHLPPDVLGIYVYLPVTQP